MPANIKAKYYTWYMTDDPLARICAFQWWPEGDFLSSMTFGTMYFITRNAPDDVWGPPVKVGSNLPWAAAQSFAHSQEFNVEVAEMD